MATLTTEKSDVAKAWISAPNATLTNTNWPSAVERASAIRPASPRAAPHSGSVPCTSARPNARTRA